MNLVVDTNVLVSGLLTPFGACGHIVHLLVGGSLVACYDARILSEYREVLHREKFGFDHGHVEVLLAYIETSGIACVCGPLDMRLPDMDDEPFLEVAIATKAACLVTGNQVHYPEHARNGVTVCTPQECLQLFRARR